MISPARQANCPVGRATVSRIWLERSSQAAKLALSVKRADILHMPKALESGFLKALEAAIALPSDVAAGIARAYRTLQAYRDGSRAVTLDSAKALSRYVRKRANQMLKAADALDRAITREEARHAKETQTK